MGRPYRSQTKRVEGVVLAGGVDGHIAENEPLPLGERGGKAVVAHHIPGKAGGAAKADFIFYATYLRSFREST